MLRASLLACQLVAARGVLADGFQPLRYRNPGLVVDLGVGLWAWPLPMDYDGDGDLDLVVSCPDRPYNGTYFFENPSGTADPIFRAAVRIGEGQRGVRVSRNPDTVRAAIERARETLQKYVNRRGENIPPGLTVAGLSLWLMEKDDGTAMGRNIRS